MQFISVKNKKQLKNLRQTWNELYKKRKNEILDKVKEMFKEKAIKDEVNMARKFDY